ncbi:hypothetical protein DKX38_008988 [Salix brachista]|uniref:Uncharacterized protein n=1 Tax=Salix brachista TaxID=2182728 RepID=A0A5N5M9M5_9ROSI|nr:hypothetical protein DKX38_008988 [Salix brachista]
MGLDPKKGTDCAGRFFAASFVGILFFLSLCACDREEVDDPQRISQEDVKVITGHEYVSRLHELKDEINRAWHAEDRVTALKLTIQVAKLLMDTSVLQFYPTLFVLATDVLDMLGDMLFSLPVTATFISFVSKVLFSFHGGKPATPSFLPLHSSSHGGTPTVSSSTALIDDISVLWLICMPRCLMKCRREMWFRGVSDESLEWDDLWVIGYTQLGEQFLYGC